MKNAVLVLMGLSLFWVSCTTVGPDNDFFPPQINTWIRENDKDVVRGIGIYYHKNSSFAMRQARTLAEEDLAISFKAVVAGLTENIQKELKARGDEEFIEVAMTATTQFTTQTLSIVQTFGPYKNKKGELFIIKYINKNKENLEKDLDTYVNDAVKDLKDRLYQLKDKE